jgi:cysteine desulfurase
VRVYLDHNATTPLRAEVIEAMARALSEVYGNPSSPHTEGALARARVERAREQVAGLLHAAPEQLLFTSGASEANNTVLRGIAALRPGRRHLVTTSVEHPSVAEPAAALEAEGWRVTRVPVDRDGRVDPEALLAAADADTALVSVIWAHNETGTIQPVEEIAARLRERGVPLHLDATQALGKLPVDLERIGADWLSASAHKLNGPKGVGCLAARRGRALPALLVGGPQERRRRGGTENVAAIVGFGVACERAAADLPERARRHGELRDRLWEGIQAKVPRARRNGSARLALANTLNVEFEGAEGEALLQALDLEGVAVSAGAACHSGSLEPSATLLAMGRSPEQARASLRFSVGLGVDEAQIDRVLALLPDLVARVRAAAGG